MDKISFIVHLKDKTNVGDWWSRPDRYFLLNISRTKFPCIKPSQWIGFFSHKQLPFWATGHIASWLAYPYAPEECRLANIDFYRYVTEKYRDI